MKSIKVYLVLVCLLAATQVSAQQSSEEASTAMFASLINFNKWIEKLTQEYNQLLASEKRDECLRKLGYLGSDLGYIALKKEKLISMAIQSNRDHSKMLTLIQEIASGTEALMNNLVQMQTLVNDNLKADGNLVLGKLKHELLIEKGRQHDAMYSDVKSKDFEKFKVDAEQGVEYLRTSEKLVYELREKLSKAAAATAR